MPVLTFVRHLALIDTDRLAAAVAVFGEGCIEAPQTVRPTFPHHVPLAAELRAEKEAREFAARQTRGRNVSSVPEAADEKSAPFERDEIASIGPFGE